jgi:hypothetical protein
MVDALSRCQSIANKVYRVLEDFFETKQAVDIEQHIYIEKDDSHLNLAETKATVLEETLLISIRFDPVLYDTYKDTDCPSISLTDKNIGFYSVVAEEVSHFHLLCQSAVQKSPLSRFDLELQAEFDKYLVASILLSEQSGTPHTHALARMLFDSAKTYADEATVYNITGSIAARWWWDKINKYGDQLVEMDSLIQRLKEIRASQGEHKINLIRNSFGPNFKKTA